MCRVNWGKKKLKDNVPMRKERGIKKMWMHNKNKNNNGNSNNVKRIHNKIFIKIIYHDPIWMIAFVRLYFCSNRKAFNAEIKIRAYCTFNTDLPGDVFVAVITVV